MNEQEKQTLLNGWNGITQTTDRAAAVCKYLSESMPRNGWKALAVLIKQNAEKKETKEDAAAIISFTDNKVMEQEREEKAATVDDFRKRGIIKSWKDFTRFNAEFDPTKEFTSQVFSRTFPRGTVSYIGARPGVGKTTFLSCMAIDAIQQGRMVRFISSEETTEQIINRIIRAVSYENMRPTLKEEFRPIFNWKETPRDHLRNYLKAKHTNQETNFFHEKVFSAAVETVRGWIEGGDNKAPVLEIFETTGARWEDITRYLRLTADAGDVVLIDYVQHLPSPEKQAFSRQLQLQDISKTLADTAAQTMAVFIAGAQFNRQANAESEDILRNDNFREAGDLEQDAHITIGIGRDRRGNSIKRYFTCMKDRENEDDKGKYWELDIQMGWSWFAPLLDETGNRVEYGTVNPAPETKTTKQKKNKKDEQDDPPKTRAELANAW